MCPWQRFVLDLLHLLLLIVFRIHHCTIKVFVNGFFDFVLQAMVPIKQMFKRPLRARSIVLLIIFYSISFG